MIYRDWVVKKNSSSVDIGANRGLHTFRLAECVGTKGAVYAFEPLPELFSALVAKAQERYGKDNHLKFFNAAVSSKTGRASFFRNLGADSRSTLIEAHFSEMAREKIDVEVVTLDNALREDQTRFLTFIKIDAEGAEYDILVGAQSLLARSSPMIAIEFDVKQMGAVGKTPNDFFDLVDSLDYNFYNIDGSPYDRDYVSSGKTFCCYERIGVKKGHHLERFVQESMKDLVLRYLHGVAQRQGVMLTD